MKKCLYIPLVSPPTFPVRAHLVLLVSNFIYQKIINSFSYKKEQWRPPNKKKKRGKNLSQRNRKANQKIIRR
jgi:hypothetical protein